MDDGYEGSTSGENAETGAETGSDTGSESQVEVTEAETSSAFDETDGSAVEGDSTAVEKSAGTGSSVETPVGDTNPSGEVKSAFDEPSAAKTESTTVSETKEISAAKEPVESVTSEKPDDSEVVHVKCTRDDLAGKEHPDTGVTYETKVVEVNGKQLEVTVPKFDSAFDCQLESEQLQLPRGKHNDICNAELKSYCQEHPDWAKETFSQKQLDQINSCKTPSDYTWHHDGGEVGHMQLVDSKIHFDTRHTGGIAIWGYKSKYT